MPPADSASRAGAMPKASGDRSSRTFAKNMRFLFIAVLSVCFSAFSHAEALSDADLRGVWHAEYATPQKDSMLGAVEWVSITFLEGMRVDWKWKRDDKIEEHKGKYSISEIPVKGVRSQSDIALNPETIAVYRPITLRNASIDHDSRLNLPEKVLKCRDSEGNWLVFSRAQSKTK